MTKSIAMLLMTLLFLGAAHGEESDQLTAAQEVEKSERDYLVRRKQVAAFRNERQRGLELFLKNKEKYEFEKEQARKEYVAKKYGRQPAADPTLEAERWAAQKASKESAAREIAREAHLQGVFKREKDIQDVKRKFQSSETYVRDNKPWNE